MEKVTILETIKKDNDKIEIHNQRIIAKRGNTIREYKFINDEIYQQFEQKKIDKIELLKERVIFLREVKTL